MVSLKKLDPNDYEGLFRIVVENEPFCEDLTREQLNSKLSLRDGWTVWKNEILIGSITLYDYHWPVNVSLHAVIDREHHSRWLTKSILYEVFKYCFFNLEVRRISSYCFPGVTDSAGLLLSGMGFTIEGTTRQGFMDPSGWYHDVVNFGMLAEECRWIRPKKK